MPPVRRLQDARWTTVVPGLALVALALTWGSDPAPVVVIVVGGFLAGAVLAAVHHAEVVAHRVGEPFAFAAVASLALYGCAPPAGIIFASFVFLALDP